MAARKYYVLLSRDPQRDRWGMEFGDYDRANVAAERQSERDNGIKAANLQIVTCNSARQSCLDYVIARLNGELC